MDTAAYVPGDTNNGFSLDSADIYVQHLVALDACSLVCI